MTNNFKTSPRVLVLTTCRWVLTARLALALENEGCEVEVVCPSKHPVHHTTRVRKTHRYHGLAGVRSFERAITASCPDLLVSTDDRATQHLHEIFNRALHSGKAGKYLCDLIERSIGGAEGFPIVYARADLIRVARAEGLLVPETIRIRSEADLANWLANTKFPTVLKVDGTNGGEGVRIVHSVDEAREAFRKLNTAPMLLRALKRALVDKDTTLIWASILGRRAKLNAQAFIVGREATSLVVCWQGKVLASISCEVLTKMYPTGPAAVLRVIQSSEMLAAAERLASRLKLSGYHGFDFILQENTGAAYLIEMNARATQVGHLNLGALQNLPRAISAVLSHTVAHSHCKLTANRTIALFPNEWLRCRNSQYLTSAYHDVPWEEPALVRDCLRNSENWNAFRDFARRSGALGRVPAPESREISERQEQFNYTCSND